MGNEKHQPTAKSKPRQVPDANRDRFVDAFGEPLDAVLNINTWDTQRNLDKEYERVGREVREAVDHETEHQRLIRTTVFPKLFNNPAGPPSGGVYRVKKHLLQKIHRGLLFNGGVEACDATVHVHDTLPLTIYQIGVGLVSYRGDMGTWHQRLFRRDLRQKLNHSVNDVLDFLERRAERAALNHDAHADSLGQMARKVIMDYAERAVLLHKSQAVWRMGHGNPIPYELLTGAGDLELMVAGTNVVRELIERHQKFVFVASEPRELLKLTIGQALPPWHYAIVETLEDVLTRWLRNHRHIIGRTLYWDEEPMPSEEWIPRFQSDIASQVVVGVYRASEIAPAQLFYAHKDHAHVAAHIVLADSMLQEERGFPMLIDLADHVCTSVFAGSLDYLTQTAYTAAGAPYRYFSERATRHE